MPLSWPLSLIYCSQWFLSLICCFYNTPILSSSGLWCHPFCLGHVLFQSHSVYIKGCRNLSSLSSYLHVRVSHDPITSIMYLHALLRTDYIPFSQAYTRCPYVFLACVSATDTLLFISLLCIYISLISLLYLSANGHLHWIPTYACGLTYSHDCFFLCLRPLVQLHEYMHINQLLNSVTYTWKQLSHCLYFWSHTYLYI